jgi:hypothetical protein
MGESKLRISKKYYSIVFAIMISFVMSFFMSLAMTLVNAGLSPHFLGIWLFSLSIAFAVSLPISIIFVPLIRRVLSRLTYDEKDKS